MDRHLTTVELPAATAKEVELAAVAAGLDTPPARLAAQLAPLLPDSVHDALIDFRQGSGDGALLLRGVGPGEVSPEAADYRDLPVAAPLLLALVSLIGTPVGARDEWDGGPLTDIRVTPGLEQTVSSKGGGSLPLHQESQHLEHPPDGLALLTVRGGAPTRLAATTDVVRSIQDSSGEELVEALRAEEYRHRLPDSFAGPGPSRATAVLIGADDMPELKVDLTTTEASTELGREALAALAATVAEVALDVPLTPGDLLIFDNRRWLHGRGDLARSSPDRWLVRSLFVYDAWRTRGDGAPGGHSPLAVFA